MREGSEKELADAVCREVVENERVGMGPESGVVGQAGLDAQGDTVMGEVGIGGVGSWAAAGQQQQQQEDDAAVGRGFVDPRELMAQRSEHAQIPW